MNRTGFVLLCLFFLAACGAGFDRVPESEVNVTERDGAAALATKMLLDQEAGKFEVLAADVATAEFRAAYGPEKQKASHETIKGMFGQFVSMKYTETARPKDGTRLKIYRFRGTFKGSTAEPEIRVVLDGEGKLAGFWLKPWMDRVQ